MKKNLILFLVLTIFIFSCQQKKKNTKIICNVENSEGQELVYYIQGQDFNKSQIKKVTNGKVIFEMINKPTEIGYIASNFNIKKDYNNAIKVFPEKKATNINFDLIKDSIQVDDNVFEHVYRFKNIHFKDGSINKKYRDLKSELSKNRKYPPVSFSKLDSLSKYVFPEYKKKVLRFYDKKIYNTNIDSILKIEILNDILVYGFLFEKIEYVQNEEKEKINLFFNEVKSNINNSNNYFKLEEKVNSINKIKPKKIKFKDFIFEDINKNKVSLSSLIAKNKFTVFYFWVYNCGPCRVFNKKVKSKNELLQKNNIEIVNINVDLTRKYWKKGTKEDTINWKNLYAGKNSDLHNHYKIKWWPTKVIFNQNKELVEYEFVNPEDLLNLVK